MVLINENGKVADLWLFKSSGYSILDQAALQSVKNWSFTPGSRGSQKIEMWVRVPVRFQLQRHHDNPKSLTHGFKPFSSISNILTTKKRDLL